MDGKMQALQALLEMLSQMDLNKMKPQDGGEVELKMELGEDKDELGLGEQPDQADEIIAKQSGGPEAPLGERELSPEGLEAGEDEEELKKLYSALE